MRKRHPSQPAHVTALGLPVPPRSRPDPDLQKYFAVCDERIGFVPNVLALHLRPGEAARLHRDVQRPDARRLGPVEARARDDRGRRLVGEPLVMNYRAAMLSLMHRAMLDFAHRMTMAPDEVGDSDRAARRKAGAQDRDRHDAERPVPLGESPAR